MRNRSQFRGPSNLAVNKAVIEPDPRRLGTRIRVVNAPQSRPIDRAEAHRAGLATRVDVAVRQFERPKPCAGSANGHDLGMRGRIVARRDLIPAFSDDRVIPDDDRAEWSATVRAHFLERKVDGVLHECPFGHDNP